MGTHGDQSVAEIYAGIAARERAIGGRATRLGASRHPGWPPAGPARAGAVPSTSCDDDQDAGVGRAGDGSRIALPGALKCTRRSRQP